MPSNVVPPPVFAAVDISTPRDDREGLINSSVRESVDQRMPAGEDNRDGLSEVEGEEEEFSSRSGQFTDHCGGDDESGHGRHARGVPAACSGDADCARVSQRCIQGSREKQTGISSRSSGHGSCSCFCPE